MFCIFEGCEIREFVLIQLLSMWNIGTMRWKKYVRPG